MVNVQTVEENGKVTITVIVEAIEVKSVDKKISDACTELECIDTAIESGVSTFSEWRGRYLEFSRVLGIKFPSIPMDEYGFDGTFEEWLEATHNKYNMGDDFETSDGVCSELDCVHVVLDRDIDNLREWTEKYSALIEEHTVVLPLNPMDAYGFDGSFMGWVNNCTGQDNVDLEEETDSYEIDDETSDGTCSEVYCVGVVHKEGITNMQQYKVARRWLSMKHGVEFPLKPLAEYEFPGTFEEWIKNTH